ncbi:MAG TPA: aldose epimerase family protein [Terriglobales bacterium]|nr:aldose epimerase family protein [Terriglobales bacterium]
MKIAFRVILCSVVLLCLALAQAAAQEAKAGLERQPFGKSPDGSPVDLYVLTNSSGMQASITNYGGILLSLKVPDRNHNFADVILGYDTLEGYEGDKSFLGATIGRYGNRIAHGKFTLYGKEYTLDRNDGENHLHGGNRGFNKVLWQAKPISSRDSQSLVLTYTSPDGEGNYPGNLNVKVTYTLTDNNELKIAYEATTDKDTIVNLTNHAYYNLAGQGESDILGHVLTIYADRFTPVDKGLIPTGQLQSVKGTPFDFTHPTAIGARIDRDDDQLKVGHGYDHNFVLNAGINAAPVPAASVYEPKSGRMLEIATTEPGIQFYSGNFLDGSIKGKQGKVYKHRYGLCLETQHYPDSPNHPDFPSTVLKKGETYRSMTIYSFSVRWR